MKLSPTQKTASAVTSSGARTRTQACSGPQVTACSPKMTFLRDDRPPLDEINLPGPRRAREGRGGAHSELDVLRYVIRCPLLPAFARAIAPRGVGRPSAYPDLFWVFFSVATRELASADKLIVTLKTHWAEICKEFFFEHDIALPAKPSVAYASFNSWRTNTIIDRYQQLEILRDQITAVSVPLAHAVRRAEGRNNTLDLLAPEVTDCIAADGTVRNAPSDVRAENSFDEDGNPQVCYPGSRRNRERPGLPRVHEAQRKVDKRSGSPEGLYNVAATTKGTDTYTRTVLAVDIGDATEAENPIAMRVLHRVFTLTRSTLPVLLYDGAITPVNWQDLMAEYGALCVNANHARNHRVSTGAGESRTHEFDPESTVSGEGQHHFGNKRGRVKRTYVTPLPAELCSQGGTPHEHYLIADDGAVYETAQPAVKGGGTRERLGLLTATAVERLQDDNDEYYYRLTLTRDCRHGGTFSITQDLRKTEPNRHGNVSWREPIANIRIIPEVAAQYPEVMGHRNQVESFFSWLEKRYLRHDRAACWGREAQLFDLICAALLHNAETWAHLAYRHPAEAHRLSEELSALPTPDLGGVKKKPVEERKQHKNQQLLRPAGGPPPVNAKPATHA